jgi:hypothetical protein
MVDIRVMAWNVRKFSPRKAAIGGFAPAVARIAIGSNVDVLVIMEATKNGTGALGTLAGVLRQLDQANHWAYTVSFTTGNERYGFFFRNLNVVRPTQFTLNPTPPPLPWALGSAALPVANLDQIQFTSWPSAFPQPAAPPPLPMPPTPGPARPQPLIAPYVRTRLDRGAKRKENFGGNPQDYGGYSAGIGARQPCLMVFSVWSAATNLAYYIPVVVCHFAAVRSSVMPNPLAYKQIRQSSRMHIMQKYAFRAVDHPNNPISGGYVAVDGVARPVQNVLLVGDSNVDFLQNNPNSANWTAKRNNLEAFAYLTPTLEAQGSAPITPAQAQAAGAVLGPPPQFPQPVPQVPLPLNAGVAAPFATEIPHQALTPAITRQGTILRQYNPANLAYVQQQNTTASLRGPCIDLMFYGGARLNSAFINPLAPVNGGVADAALAVDVPASLMQPGQALAPGQIQVGAVQQYYNNPPYGNRRYLPGTPRHNANLAGNLNAGGPNQPGLSLVDRWLGANLLSDHVPVLLQFTCP